VFANNCIVTNRNTEFSNVGMREDSDLFNKTIMRGIYLFMFPTLMEKWRKEIPSNMKLFQEEMEKDNKQSKLLFATRGETERWWHLF
jgi:hypothetical protein